MKLPFGFFGFNDKGGTRFLDFVSRTLKQVNCMKNIKQFFLGLLLMAATLTACNNENRESKGLNSGLVYTDYKISGEENKEAVTIFVQFRMGAKNGSTLVLEDGAKVELDGEQLRADSAGKSGAFYEVQKRLDEFSGTHTIVFTDVEGKEHPHEFEFFPFTLAEPIPAQVQRNAVIFNLEGLDSIDLIHIILTDTAFATDDINSIDTIRNGRLVINEQRLSGLKSGPVSLQLFRDKNQRVRKGGRTTGQVFTTYGLRREFELE